MFVQFSRSDTIFRGVRYTKNMSEIIISLDSVSITYPNGYQAISNITLQLHNNIVCGLIGINGSGKSTLFKAIMGLLTPTSGIVRIEDKHVKAALAQKKISYVPQTEEIDWNFPILVEELVMTGRYAHMGPLRIASAKDKEEVDKALEHVNMLEYKKRQIGELSGGQKKRVFVARSLAQGGKIILLDEPFTGVDASTEEMLIELFVSFSRAGRLVVVSTHNLGSVPAFCDEVVLINKVLLAHGSVESTFTEENLMRVFGGNLRHERFVAKDIHKDQQDTRGITVLTDEERALVLYGEEKQKKDILKRTSKT